MLSRLNQARASSLSISSLGSLPGGSAAGSPCEELASLLAPSSGPSRNVAVLAGVPVAISLLTACVPVDGPAVVVSRREGFFEDTMIVNRARRSA